MRCIVVEIHASLRFCVSKRQIPLLKEKSRCRALSCDLPCASCVTCPHYIVLCVRRFEARSCIRLFAFVFAHTSSCSLTLFTFRALSRTAKARAPWKVAEGIPLIVMVTIPCSLGIWFGVRQLTLNSEVVINKATRDPNNLTQQAEQYRTLPRSVTVPYMESLKLANRVKQQ